MLYIRFHPSSSYSYEDGLGVAFRGYFCLPYVSFQSVTVTGAGPAVVWPGAIIGTTTVILNHIQVATHTLVKTSDYAVRRRKRFSLLSAKQRKRVSYFLFKCHKVNKNCLISNLHGLSREATDLE